MGQQLGSAARAAGLRPVSGTLGQHLIRMGCEEVAQLLQLLGFDRFDLRALKARRLTGGWRLRPAAVLGWRGGQQRQYRLCSAVGEAGRGDGTCRHAATMHRCSLLCMEHMLRPYAHKPHNGRAYTMVL